MRRKNLLILLGLTAAVTMSGCGQSNNTKETQAPASAAIETEAESEAADVETELESESADVESEPESDAADVETEPESDTTADETESESADAETESESDVVADQTETESEAANLESEPESEAADLESEPESDTANLESDAESETTANETDLESEPESDAADVETEPESDATADETESESADVESEPESDVVADQTESEAETTADQTDVESESEAADVESEPESEAADLESESESETESIAASDETDLESEDEEDSLVLDEEDSTEDELDEEDDEEDETEVALDPITPSDYLIADASDYITLGDITGIPAIQYTYEVTDDMVEEEIASELYYYSDEVSVDRPAQEDDIVYVDLVSMVQGDEDSEYTESTYFVVGDGDYGTDFDAQLMGASIDDTLEFSVTYEDDAWYSDWMNATVDFQVTITDVCEQVIPELNEEFVQEYTEYNTVDEYTESIREYLENDSTQSSQSEVIDSLFDSATELCEFNGYPQELYDSCLNEILSFYLMFTDSENLEDVYEVFDITEEDLEDDILSEVYKRLLISAICQENGLEVTEEEYMDYVTLTAMSYGYDSAADFESDSTRESIVWSMYETLAGTYLYENADITTSEYDSSAESLDEDWAEEEDGDIGEDTETELLSDVEEPESDIAE